MKSGHDSSRGRVIANYGQSLLVETADGDTVTCIPRKAAGPVICGDSVEWLPQPNGPAVVTTVDRRSSLLSRPDQRGKPKLVCANIDRIVVCGALNPGQPGLRHDMLDNYLVAAENLGVEAIIIVNKIDLADPPARDDLETTLTTYRAIGYPVIATSVARGDGLDELRKQLKGHRSVLVGESGVGKSSLIDFLVPDHELRIGALSARSGLGRHTTTVTMLFHLPDGGDIIDSPGVREFRLWPLPAAELARGFREFQAYLGQCRYRDCRHLEEPGCALATAVDEGRISAVRLASYRSLLDARS